MCRWSHEGKFFAPVKGLGQQSFHGLSEHILLCAALDTHGRRHRYGEFRQLVIEEGRSSLHRVRHIGPVSAPGEDLSLQHRLDPHILGLVQRVSSLNGFAVQRLRNSPARRVILQGPPVPGMDNLRNPLGRG